MYDQFQGGGRPGSEASARPDASSVSGDEAEMKALQKYNDAKFQDPDLGNALADSLRGPKARALSTGEHQQVGISFGTLVDTRDVAIIDGPGNNSDAKIAFDIGGNPAITEGNNIYIAHKYYRVDFADPSHPTFTDNVDTLIHEFTHVYQYQTLGFCSFFLLYAAQLVAFGGADECYRYDKRKLPFRYESLEGQAAMVGHYAQYMAGGTPYHADTMANIATRLKSTGIFSL
jgi:hypothetical protein